MTGPSTTTIGGNEDWAHYFQPGETLLWQAAPLPGVHGKGKIIALACFGLPFLIVGITVGVAGVRQMLASPGWNDAGMGLFFTTFCLPFAGAGAAMVFGPWYAAHWAHAKIRYALSTRAAYVAKSYWTRSIAVYPILKSSATGLEKGHRADTVWFHVNSEKDSDGERSITRVAFENIADGDTVFRMIRSIQMGTP